MKKSSEKQFIQDVRNTLNEANRNLNGSTASRLARSRHGALKTRRPKRKSIFLGWSTVPVTVTLLLAAIFFNLPGTTTMPITSEVSDWQILTAEDTLEFYQEDIGFYEWLSEELEEKDLNGDNVDNSHSATGDKLVTGNSRTRSATAYCGAPGISWHI